MKVEVKVEINGDVIFQVPSEIPEDKDGKVDTNLINRVIYGALSELSMFVHNFAKDPPPEIKKPTPQIAAMAKEKANARAKQQ